MRLNEKRNKISNDKYARCNQAMLNLWYHYNIITKKLYKNLIESL